MFPVVGAGAIDRITSPLARNWAKAAKAVMHVIAFMRRLLYLRAGPLQPRPPR
jgi:hypothetical protein